MKRLANALFLVFTLLCASCGKMKMPELTMPKMLQPDPPEVKAQNQIAAILKTNTDEKLYREISNLLELANKINWDTGRLLHEAMAYIPNIKDDDQQARFLRLVTLLRPSKSAIVDAAGARLGSKGRETAICQALLREAAPPDPRGAADFSQFKQYLAARQSQMPRELVLWMYERDPAAAMELMIDILGSRLPQDDVQTIVIAARVLDQMDWKVRYGLATETTTDELVMQQLEKLAGFQQWCIRLYVAKILAKHPETRRPALVSKLANDPDPLVAYVMGSVVAKQ